MRDSVSEPFALSLLLFRSFITAAGHHFGVMMQPSSHQSSKKSKDYQTWINHADAT